MLAHQKVQLLDGVDVCRISAKVSATGQDPI